MLATLVLSLLPQSPTPTAGTDIALANARSAAISQLHYELSFALTAPVTEVQCNAVLRFELAAAACTKPLVVDFDGEVLGEVLGEVMLNDTAVAAVRVEDHLVLPADGLRVGANELRLLVRSKVAQAGTPLTVYRDDADQREYCYTLVVPADAHRLYPCFDQPDLKATFDVQLQIPAAWSAIGNGRAARGEAEDGRRTWRFARTKPLPTYLMAFACGPFLSIQSPLPGIPGMAAGSTLRTWFRASESERVDVKTLATMHGAGLQWLCDYFGVEYPFEKLDIVLVPGFPYGGMEHAGAIFYREKALSFDHTPTAGELARRSTLIYHELSHQWFGNLVTMKWFDDLWLKEGFATFVAHQVMADLEPERLSWLRFLQRVKPRAYEVDSTPGTVPVFLELGNLADAKSAYGPIVYNKAPAVLRELHDRLGAEVFRAGVHAFLTTHSYGNASWRDLATALETAASADLSRWSTRWLLSPSLPRLRVKWTVAADNTIATASLHQEPVLDADRAEAVKDSPSPATKVTAPTWPVRLELLAIGRDGTKLAVTVESDVAAQPIESLLGAKDVVCIVQNPSDVAYGQFLPDEKSRAWMLSHAATTTDPLLRSVMLSGLFEAVREAELDPAAFAETTLEVIARERDADTHGWLLDLLGTCMLRYLPDERALPLRERAEETLLTQLGEPASGRELQTFRWLARNSAGPATARLCRAVALGVPEDMPKELKPGKEDRFLALAALLAKAPEGDREVLETTVRAAFANEDIGREMFLARAAIATAANKQEYFDAYLRLEAPPEQWTQDSLGNFHWPGQGATTLPLLRAALENASWVKKNRRIFFMPAWFDAFVNGHSDANALAIVDQFLATATLDADVRKKLLQSRDGLARAVRVRAAFARAK